MIDSNLLVLSSAMCSRCLVHSGLSQLGSGCGCRSGYVDPLICCAVGVSGHVLWALDGEATKALKTIEHLFYTSRLCSMYSWKESMGGGWALRTKRVDNKALPRTEAESVLSDLPASAIVLFLWRHVKWWLPRLRVLSLARMVRESHELGKKPFHFIPFLLPPTGIGGLKPCSLGWLLWLPELGLPGSPWHLLHAAQACFRVEL